MIHEVSGNILLTKAHAVHGVAQTTISTRGWPWPCVRNGRRWSRTSDTMQVSAIPNRARFGVRAVGIQVFDLLTQEGEHHHGAKPGKATTANVNHSLKRLRHTLEKERVKSLALPKLATGVGGLAWSDVLPLVHHHLAESETVVFVYTQFHQGVPAREPGV